MKLRCINMVSQKPEGLAGFYQKVLGGTVQEIVPGRWELPVGGVALVFTHTCEEVRVPAESCGLEFQVANADGEYARLQGAGVPVEAPPATYPWQWRGFGVKDSDGNNLDFVQYVGDK